MLPEHSALKNVKPKKKSKKKKETPNQRALRLKVAIRNPKNVIKDPKWKTFLEKD